MEFFTIDCRRTFSWSRDVRKVKLRAKKEWSMAQQEQVLVVELKVIEKLGLFHGLMFDVDRYLNEIFAQGVLRFIPRDEAEENPNYKQLIPYVIMTHNGKYLSYVRGKRAGESRLQGLRSIGIGGHINPVDWTVFTVEPRKTYLAAVEREVAEEVSVETKHADKIVALLNDDSNEVGRVHLGVVHLWTLDEPKVQKREQMITQMDFMTIEELQNVKDTMETWSSLCLEHLDQMDSKKISTSP
jgi:predicted NUDIX family phosphoesterase